MENRRGILDAACIAAMLAVIPGFLVGARSVIANRHFAHGHDLLAWLELSDWINRLGQPVALVVGPLILVSVVVPLLPGKRGSDAMRFNLILLIGMTVVFFVGVGLRRFTDFSLGLAVDRAWIRLKTGSAPATLGEGIGAVVLTYAAAFVGMAIVVIVTIWLNRQMRRVDLPRVDLGVWFPRRIVYPIGAAAFVVGVAVNLFAVAGQLRAQPGTTNVILICVDSLRADALGYSGYGLNTSPFIDSLAERSIVFRNAESQASWTGLSVASYLASDYSAFARMTTTYQWLPRSKATLPEVLRNGGYETGAITSNPWIKREFGFDQGFEFFDEKSVQSWRIRVPRIIRFLARPRSRPFFLYIHFMDVHSPYEAPSPYFDMFATVEGSYRTDNGLMPDLSQNDLSYTRARYDGEVRFLDEKLRSLFEFLESSSLSENTVVMIMADHGEEFHEHGGMGHGTTLYGELINIPLMIVDPGILDATTFEIDDLVRGVDLMPTVLEIAGVPVPHDLDGRSLLGLVRGRNLPPAASIAGVISRDNGDRLFSMSKNGYRYIYNMTRGEGELFDTHGDRLNAVNLVDSASETAAEMESALRQFLTKVMASGDADDVEVILDDETLENLKALGYL